MGWFMTNGFYLTDLNHGLVYEKTTSWQSMQTYNRSVSLRKCHLVLMLIILVIHWLQTYWIHLFIQSFCWNITSVSKLNQSSAISALMVGCSLQHHLSCSFIMDLYNVLQDHLALLSIQECTKTVSSYSNVHIWGQLEDPFPTITLGIWG